jgi:hypothetical protein
MDIFKRQILKYRNVTKIRNRKEKLKRLDASLSFGDFATTFLAAAFGTPTVERNPEGPYTHTFTLRNNLVDDEVLGADTLE